MFGVIVSDGVTINIGDFESRRFDTGIIDYGLVSIDVQKTASGKGVKVDAKSAQKAKPNETYEQAFARVNQAVEKQLVKRMRTIVDDDKIKTFGINTDNYEREDDE